MIEQLKQTQEMIAKLLSLIEIGETDKFAAIFYQARWQYRRISERPKRGNKATEREIISSYQIAQSLGFNGDFPRVGALAADSRLTWERKEDRAAMIGSKMAGATARA